MLLETDCKIFDPYGCKDCENRCDIQQIELTGKRRSREIVTWGGYCGKYDHEERQKREITENYLKVEKTITSRLSDNIAVENPRGNIGIPLGLQNWYYYIFWKAFFAKLKYRVIFSEKTDINIIKEGCETAKAEYCFPVKVFHGAVKDLLRNNALDCIFIPAIIESDNRNCPDNSFYCNYIAAEPFYLDSAFDFSKIKQKIIRPIISSRDGNSAIALKAWISPKHKSKPHTYAHRSICKK